MEIDLGVERSVRVIAGIFPNISSSGTVRVRASSTAGDFTSPIYDSGAVTVWPSGETAETLDEIKPTFIKVPAAQSARYWLWEMSDTGNADGYLEVARIVLAAGWQPSLNFRYGAQFGVETDTERKVTEGSTHIYDIKPCKRWHRLQIDHLPDSESRRSAFDMQRIAGIDKQMWFVPDPDSSLLWLESYLCTLRELSFLELARVGKNHMGFETIEEI